MKKNLGKYLDSEKYDKNRAIKNRKTSEFQKDDAQRRDSLDRQKYPKSAR